jgi:hypothetical protein
MSVCFLGNFKIYRQRIFLKELKMIDFLEFVFIEKLYFLKAAIKVNTFIGSVKVREMIDLVWEG